MTATAPAPATSPHRVLLASAGTGKTWRLTTRYLALLLAGVDPGRILATTFTRKAAGEILDRVLARLVEASERREAIAAIAEHEPEVAAATPEGCRDLLARLARRLDRFHVGTLDAFFVRLGHLYALDLGLPSDWAVAEDHDVVAMRSEAVGRVLSEDDREQLVELLRSLQRQSGPKRSIQLALERAVEEGRSTWVDALPEAWTRLAVPPGLDEVDLARLAGLVETVERPTTKAGLPRKRWVRALDELAGHLAEGRWEAVLANGIVSKVLEGETHFDRVEIPAVLVDASRRLAGHVRHVQLAELDRRNRATAAFLERFEAQGAGVKRERARYGFDDLPLALAPAVPGEVDRLAARELDIAFRLDGRIDHLLLDEFQDTSPLQWRVLAGLADSIRAEAAGRSVFCVGDVKQSIYGFREAEPRLLSELAESWSGWARIESLRLNRRSSPVILDTVDRVFPDLAGSDVLASEDREVYREAAVAWLDGYGHHEARFDRRPGVAWLLEAADSSDAGDDGPVPAAWRGVLDLVVARVAELATSAPSATVAVLLRSNRPIPWILERLAARGLHASGEGGNPLTDAAAVQQVLSLLHLADHPGDSAAAFHVATSPLGAAFDVDDPTSRSCRARVSRTLRRRLAEEGYGEVCACCLDVVGADPLYGAWDRHRCQQLVDMAYAFDDRRGLRADRFVDQVLEAKVEDATSSRVKVMTVHASKGLEFDAVILPELDEQLAKQVPDLLSERPAAAGKIETVSTYATDRVARLDPLLRRLHDGHRRRDFGESLSILYVAMTRARRRLEMIVRPESAARLRYAAFLREALVTPAGGDTDPVGDGSGAGAGSDGECHGTGLGSDGEVVAGVAVPVALAGGEPSPFGAARRLWRHEAGDEAGWAAGLAGAEGDGPAPEEARGARGVPWRLRPTARNRVRRRRPSAGAGAPRWRASDILAAPSPGAARGSLVHRWLEELEWLDDFEPGDDELAALVAGMEPDGERLREVLGSFRAALEQPEVAALLRRPAGGDDLFAPRLEVWRERPFTVWLPEEEGGEALWSGAFDRVVLRWLGETLEGAEVIDYKTDRVDARAVARRAEVHAAQMAGYRRALAAMTGLDESRIVARLVFLHPGRVVTLAV